MLNIISLIKQLSLSHQLNKCKQNQFLVLAYHAIKNCKTVGKDIYTVTTRNFINQMKMLKLFFTVISPNELFKTYPSGRPRILITFDDGVKNNFSEAFPVLYKLKLPALFFIPTDFVGKDGYMTEEEIKHVSRHNISIGSHSHTHCDFGKIDNQQTENELKISKKILDKLMLTETTLFAYPYGNTYNTKGDDKEILNKTGYKYAFLYGGDGKPRIDDPYRIPRMMVTDVLGTTLTAQIFLALQT